LKELEVRDHLPVNEDSEKKNEFLVRQTKEDLVRQRKEENEEIELEVKWQQATSPAEETSLIVKVHVSDNVEAVSFSQSYLRRLIQICQNERFWCVLIS
jgi:hypothetical protein